MKRFLTLCLLLSAAALLSGCPGQNDQSDQTASPPATHLAATETATNQADASQSTDKTSSNQAADKAVTNSISMEFVLIPAGSFMMGEEQSLGDYENAIPQHRVTISQPFYLGKYEVTQREWEAVMGNNPSEFKGQQNNPVENVSWNDVQTFIERLNQKEGTKKYRLPTEAEWEYAAHAGTTTVSFGDDEEDPGRYAWYEDNSNWETHPVGQKEPNPWGLYDVHGNVLEWVQDWFDGDYYSRSPAIDPRGPSEGKYRVIRSSGSGDSPWALIATGRGSYPPEYRNGDLGFRLAFSPDRP
jgi:formylglycine-generating enzyme required for sulfatase activity